MCQNCHSPFDADVNYYKRDYFIWLPVKQQVIKLVLVKALKLRILFVDRFIKIWLEVGKCSKIICPCNLIWIVLQCLNHQFIQFGLFGKELRSLWHLLVCGLVIKKKTLMNTFLKPFVSELVELGKEMLYVGVVMRKVFVLFLSADAPARAIVRNSKQFPLTGFFRITPAMHWQNFNETWVTSLANISADSNSSLRIVCFTSGATLVFGVKNLRHTLLVGSIFKYSTASF